MDRASDSGSEGWGFESLPAYQKMRIPIRVSAFFDMLGGTRKAGPGTAGVRNSPADCFLGRGRIPFLSDAPGTAVDERNEAAPSHQGKKCKRIPLSTQKTRITAE